MSYILIIAVIAPHFAGAYTYPAQVPLVTMQAFGNKAACDNAAATVKSMVGSKDFRQITTACVSAVAP